MPSNNGRSSPIWVRLWVTWVAARDSLWFIPALFTVAAAALATLLIAEEQYQWLPWRLAATWLLGAGADGAQQVLSSIASGLITVTGVVFSVTIVALQLASSQYTPRLLRNFVADRVNQLVLGVFIGTFTYALLVLGVIQHTGRGHQPFVPQLAVLVAVILVLVSIGFLIYFINHAVASMRISIILDRVTKQTLEQIASNSAYQGEKLHPYDLVPPPWNMEQAAPVMAANAGYLTAVDARVLFQLGQEHQLTIRMECDVGQFLLPGQMLVTVVPAERLDDHTADIIQRAFVLGAERTPEQDIEFGIIEIADIAIKALSAAINDPTTAMHCIDRLSQILLALAQANPPPDLRSADGQAYFIGRHLPFERAVGLAFDQIQHYGASSPTIVNKLLAVLCHLIQLVPLKHRQPLIEQAHGLLEQAETTLALPFSRREIERLTKEFHLLCEVADRLDAAPNKDLLR
jgi:uncharacterized membrane protein